MATQTITEEVLSDFQTQLRGAAIGSGDPAAAQVRDTFNAMHQRDPAITVECSGTADVVDAVRFARDNGLDVAVRGGGHSIAGLSTIEGGMLIDLAPMRGVVVDPERRLVHVQGGALWGDVDRETQAFGLATPGGVVSDTGVAGLTLGGGYGWLRRRHGLSCDNVVEAQVVCADGEVRTASADVNPDLFWAIRGGGGNFGIVTSFTFRLHAVGPMVAFSGTFYPAEEYREVMRGWRAFTEQAPDEITSVCVSLTFPDDPHMPEAVRDRAVAIVGAVYTGDVDEGLALTEPLRGLGTALADLSGPMPYSAVNAAFDGLFPRNTVRAYWKSLYLENLTDDAIETLRSRVLDRPAPLTLVNTMHMGGAIAKVDPEATAFAARRAPFMVSIDGVWHETGDDERCIEWVRSAFADIGRHGTGEVYLNFTGRSDEALTASTDSAFGRNLERLARIKANYDPDNFFRFNNNIAPAG